MHHMLPNFLLELPGTEIFAPYPQIIELYGDKTQATYTPTLHLVADWMENATAPDMPAPT